MSEEIQKIQAIAVPIFQAAGFTYVGLFGSCARGEATADSDVDFLYDHDKDLKLSLFGLLDVKYELEEKLNKKVDLVHRGNLKPRVEPYVNKDLIVLYEKR